MFVEVGANDGERFSQSLFFEEQLNWRGLCVEPQPNKFRALTLRRPHCLNVNAGVSNGSSGTMTFLQVLCVRFYRTLNALQIHGYSEMLSSFEDFITPAHRQRIEREVAEHKQTVRWVWLSS